MIIFKVEIEKDWEEKIETITPSKYELSTNLRITKKANS